MKRNYLLAIATVVTFLGALVAAPAVAKWDDIMPCEVTFPCCPNGGGF